MGVRILDVNSPEPILRPRDHVLFVGDWPSPWRPFIPQRQQSLGDWNYWTVDKTHQIKFQSIAILGQGEGDEDNVFEIELSDVNGFIPRNVSSLYEMRVAFKGTALLNIIWPTPSTTFHQLENPSFRPDLESDVNRYVGALEPGDLGLEENGFRERLLRLHTVEDMQPQLLRFFADTVEEDEKVVVDFFINRIKLTRLDEAPPAWRPILHYEQFSSAW